MTRRLARPLALLVALLLSSLGACSRSDAAEDGGDGSGGGGGVVSPCRLEYEYSVVGGTLRGTLVNHQSETLGAVDVSVTVRDRDRRLLGTRQLTLTGPFRSGRSPFSLATGFAAGRFADLSTVACRR